MSNRKMYRTKLSADERKELELVAQGKRGQLKIAAWKVQRANAMLMCDEGEFGPAWRDEDVAEAFSTTTRSLENWRKQAVLNGPLSVLQRQRRVSTKGLVLDGEKEAKLTQLACSKPVNGKSKWSLRMLADRLIELEIVDSISHETVRRTMKKRFKAMAKVDVVHSAETEWCFCRGDGTSIGSISAALRRSFPGCLHGRTTVSVDL